MIPTQSQAQLYNRVELEKKIIFGDKQMKQKQSPSMKLDSQLSSGNTRSLQITPTQDWLKASQNRQNREASQDANVTRSPEKPNQKLDDAVPKNLLI